MKHLVDSIKYFMLYTVVCGVMYPLLVTGISRTFFNEKAEGSLIERNGTIIGSKLLGQEFKGVKYFWSRPSATSPTPYNPMSSSGSNVALTNPAFGKSLQERIDYLKGSGLDGSYPVDLVTASGSGLDPEISVASALFQAPRIAKARSIDRKELEREITEASEGRLWGIFGERRVNVLKLNIALDERWEEKK